MTAETRRKCRKRDRPRVSYSHLVKAVYASTTTTTVPNLWPPYTEGRPTFAWKAATRMSLFKGHDGTDRLRYTARVDTRGVAAEREHQQMRARSSSRGHDTRADACVSCPSLWASLSISLIYPVETSGEALSRQRHCSSKACRGLVKTEAASKFCLLRL